MITRSKSIDQQGQLKAAAEMAFNKLTPTIFHEQWWLEAATGGRVEFVEVTDGGRTVGRLPYTVNSRYGLTSSNMPTLTHFLGPGIDDGGGSEANRYVKRHSITQELIRKLPPLSSFRQKMHRGVCDALPFQAQGYNVQVQFTFEIEPYPDAVIWKAMRDKTRNVIRRAAENFDVHESSDPEAFFHLSAAHLEERSLQANIDFGACKEVAIQAVTRGRGHIWVARESATGRPKAAIFCVFDNSTYYYLMSTRAPDAGNGVVPLLLWNAIQSAAAMGRVFDFDGIVNAGSILLFSGFGGKTSPRYIVTKASMPYRVLRQIRRMDSSVTNTFC
ncbi:GNAT family N-acetyltransferase [Rhizobium sp.]|uniref:GNAT family N-acetyltransferase n=1 Tax=Rhizobium sp. TaxID=391 RepID=UPI0028973A2D